MVHVWLNIENTPLSQMVGDYSKLEGGMTLIALEAMTGDHVAHFKASSDLLLSVWGRGGGSRKRKYRYPLRLPWRLRHLHSELLT